MQKFLVFLLLCFSLNAFAGKLLIVGKPTELVAHEGYFTFPENYTPNGDYRFITLAGLLQVCYLRNMPQLGSLPSQFIRFEDAGVIIRWTCYKYDPKYFEKDF